MFIWTSLIGFLVFFLSLLKVFNVKKHPFTLLAFSGAISYTLVIIEFIHLFNMEWKSLLILPVCIFSSWYAYATYKKMENSGAKKIIIQSLIPTFFVLGYLFFYNIWFLFPMVIMATLTTAITPKDIKEKRKNLFIKS